MAMIREHLASIQKNISLICQRLGRNPAEITLIGVTKYATVEKIKEALTCGLTDVGENKVQEAEKKFPQLDSIAPKLRKHMIGHLQTNKAKDALKYFDLIQSVDSLKLAQEIDKQAAKINRVADILVQINTSGEEQKYGAEKTQALSLVDEITSLQHVRILGLMTMAAFTEDKEAVRVSFRALREIRDQVSKKFGGHERVQMKYLSMGMTDDYEIALEEGSNMVRIGRAIFQ